MDDFQVVLGMTFMRKSKAVPIPHLGKLCIADKGSPYLIPMVKGSKKAQMLSTMHLTLVEKDHDGSKASTDLVEGA